MEILNKVGLISKPLLVNFFSTFVVIYTISIYIFFNSYSPIYIREAFHIKMCNIVKKSDIGGWGGQQKSNNPQFKMLTILR